MVKVKKLEDTVISLSQPAFLYDRKKIKECSCDSAVKNFPLNFRSYNCMSP
jgi:hypothetical protein